MKVDYVSYFLKTSVLIILLASLPLKYSISACIFAAWAYQYAIAVIFGVHVMPTMDMICFLGNDKANANWISFTVIEKYPFEKVKAKIT